MGSRWISSIMGSLIFSKTVQKYYSFFLRRSKDIKELNRFIAHNRKAFLGAPQRNANAPIMLMELNGMHSAHIAYSYLANEMAVRHGAQIKAYGAQVRKSVLRDLVFDLRVRFGRWPFGVYKSFGINEFVKIKLTKEQLVRTDYLYADLLQKLKSKRDVEDLHVAGVWVGDLVYDSYLMTYKEPTIDLNSNQFSDFLRDAVGLFVFWDDYFTNNDVCGINVSHCVYTLAIPLRLAVARSIPVFQANVTHVYRLSSENLFAYNDFFSFPERFATLPKDVREAGLAVAEHRIRRRFSGEVGVDMSYSTKSAFGTARHDRLLRESQRKKILIATHCFFDSPHCYGKNIFPDFYEWLEFLGEMSELTDYDWYIKTHPDYLPGTKEIIDGFVARYTKFTLLPSNASHMQIISEGIDVALTSYGTIGFEYAALGVPVINASMNNPHIAYNFNIHARDVEHYRELLENLEKLDLSINRREVYEYYFMKHIYNTEDLFFKDYQTTIDDIGGYKEQFTPLIYEKWCDEWLPVRHKEIVAALRRFVDSGEFRMDYSSFGREFTLDSLEKLQS